MRKPGLFELDEAEQEDIETQFLIMMANGVIR
jgi:hypothetical protein